MDVDVSDVDDGGVYDDVDAFLALAHLIAHTNSYAMAALRGERARPCSARRTSSLCEVIACAKPRMQVLEHSPAKVVDSGSICGLGSFGLHVLVLMLIVRDPGAQRRAAFAVLAGRLES